MAAVVQVQHVVEVGRFRQDSQPGVWMAGEQGDHHPRIARQRVEGHAVLQLAQVERLLAAEPSGYAVDLGQDGVEVDVDFDGGREPHALRAGEVAILAAVGAEAVGREVPEVGAGVALFVAAADRTTVFTEHEHSMPAVMQIEGVAGLDADLVVRDSSVAR